MNRCVIICGYLIGRIDQAISLQPNDYIICADAGLDLAQKEGITPHLYIGDGDSKRQSFGGACIHLPVRKDDTDLMAAVKHAITKGFSDLWIVGGMGGRLDHSIASIQTLAYAREHGAYARLVDRDTTVRLCDSRLCLPRRPGFSLSLFAYGGRCEGVSLSGVSYPLQNAILTPDFPLGVSNEITDSHAVVEVKSGLILAISSRLEKQT